MFLAGRRFGRNPAPPGIFQDFFGPSEPRLRCATFVHFAFRWFGLLRSQFAIYWIFWGSGGLRKISRPPGARSRPKTPKKWIFPVLGAVLGETLADQISPHAKCGPHEPFLWPHVSLGPEIWPFFFGGGAFRRVGDRFCWLETQPTKKIGP